MEEVVERQGGGLMADMEGAILVETREGIEISAITHHKSSHDPTHAGISLDYCDADPADPQPPCRGGVRAR